MGGNNQRNQRITAVMLFGFSLFYLISSFWLKLGTARKPGPGLVPVIIGIILLVFTTLYLIRVFGAQFSGGSVSHLERPERQRSRSLFRKHLRVCREWL